jgi:3-mercaptopyruvate sulfurtransferase SseA
MTNAARVWFILQYFGVKAVVLNGGWLALSSATGLPAGAMPRKSGFRASPGAGSVGLVDRETLKRQLDGDAHTSSTPERARSLPEKICVIVRAVGISLVLGICRIPISWTTALFCQHRFCEP